MPVAAQRSELERVHGNRCPYSPGPLYRGRELQPSAATPFWTLFDYFPLARQKHKRHPSTIVKLTRQTTSQASRPHSDLRQREVLRQCRHALFRGLVFNDVPSHGAGRDSQRTCKVHLTGTASSGKVAVLRADDNLIQSCGHAWPRVDASPATRFNDFRSRLLEDP